MKRLWILLALLMCSLPAQAVVTYQGQLVHDGQRYTGTAEIRFSLWDSAQGGNELADHTNSVQVVNGLFQKELSFGNVHFLEPGLRWIEVEVLQPGPATTLVPRQRVRNVPRAYLASRTRGGLFEETHQFHIQGPGGKVFTAGRPGGGDARVGIGNITPRAHLSIGNNLDFWSMGGNHTADRPTIRGTPSSNLAISAADDGALHLNADGGSGGIRFYDGSGGSSGERMRLTQGGRLGIGTSDPFEALHVAGHVHIDGDLTIDTLDTPWGTSPEVCRNSFNRLSTCSSSVRYKRDIEPLDLDAGRLAELQPVRYRWRDRDEADVGLIAEEVAEVFPELVFHDDEGQIEGIVQSRLMAVVIAAHQQFKQQIERAIKSLTVENADHRSATERLAEQLAAVESENADLRAEIAVLIGASQEQQAKMATQQVEITALRSELEAERETTTQRLSTLEALMLEDRKVANTRE